MTMVLNLLICFLLIQRASADILDDFDDAYEELQEKLEDELEDIDDDLKGKLKDAKKFRGITREQLTKLKQDMLSYLKSTAGMTEDQFEAIEDRLDDFRSDNLKSLLGNINSTVFQKNLKDLLKKTWEKAQINAIAKASLDDFGDDVSEWSEDQIKSLSKFLAGLPSADFSKFPRRALNKSLEEFCDIDLSFQQKVNLLEASSKIFGDFDDWDDDIVERLCDNIEALSPDDILKIPASEISKLIANLTRYAFSESQREAILEKIKEDIGDIQNFNISQFKALKGLMKNLDIEDIKNLTLQQLRELEDVDWDEIQEDELLDKLEDELGSVKNWTDDDIENAFELLPELDDDFDDDDDNETVSKIWKAITLRSKQAKWKLKQAHRLLEDDPKEPKDYNKSDIVKRAQFIYVMIKNDTDDIPDDELLDALEEIKEKVNASEPFLRHVISLFNKSSKGIENLGQFIKGLSSYELSELDIPDILNKTERLDDDDLDDSDVAELMEKVRKQLGNLSDTDSEDFDIMKWGFQNFKKMGKVALALERDELEDFPFTGIESSLDILGKQSGWTRRKVLAVAKRVKQYWQKLRKSLNTLEERDVEVLGKFAQGLMKEDLDDLDDKAKPMVIELLGKFDGLPEDKLEERAEFAYDFLKKKRKGELSSADLKVMGKLLSGLSNKTIQSMQASTLLNNIEDLLDDDDMSKGKLRNFFDAVKSQIKNGNMSAWSVDDFRKLLPAIKTLKPSEINSISKEVFESLLDEIEETDDDDLEDDQKEAIIEKVKELYGDVEKWNGSVLDNLKSVLSALKPSDVSKLTREQIEDMIDELGDDEFSREDAKRFADQLKKLGYANISGFPIKTLRQLKNVLIGYSSNDLEDKVDIDDADELDIYGSLKGWSKEQLKVLKEKAKKFLNKSGNINDYTSLKNLIKGFDEADIDDIPDEAFKIAIGKFGEVDDIDDDVAELLMEKAKKVWSNQYTNARVIDAGSLLVGLNKTDIPKLPKSSVAYIKPSVIKRMDKEKINGFKVDQLKELNIQQVKAIQPSARASLPPAKAQALHAIENEERGNPRPSSGSSINSSSFLFLSICTIFFKMALW